MRILLINPSLHRATTGQYEKEVEKKRGLYPPLGLVYIAGTLEKENHEVKIFDCDAEDSASSPRILEICANWQPALVGFYAMTWTYFQAKELAEKIKKFNPQIITVIGGPNVSCLPRESVELGQFDFGVRGEGEKTIIELVDHLQKKNLLAPEQIKGLIFKKNGEVIINPARDLITDLDNIPFPARHLLPVEKYFDIFARQKKIATLIATRGCPFECIFCDRENRMGRSWRVRSPENIVKEIKEIKEKHGIKEFMFFDDNLIVDKAWGLELCRQLKPLKIIWECRNRVDLVDEELLTAMKKAGCYRIRFGFESGDDRILKLMKKAITVKQSLLCAKICHQVKMEIFGYFMMGLPTETPAEVEKTIAFALKTEPAFAVFSKAIMIPGSELFAYGVQNKLINFDYWKKYLSGEETNGAPALASPQLPEKLVDKYIKKAEQKFYFRFNFILKRLLAIRSFGHLVSQARIAFALLFN